MNINLPTTTRSTVARSSVGAAVVLSILASACGSSSEASEPWCEAVADLDAAIGSIGVPDEETIRETFSSLAPVGARIADDAPADVRKAAARVATAIDQAAATGRPELFEPPTSTAMADVHAFAADECGYESVSVEALDFAFGGLPASVPAGRIALSFDNRSADEDHELVLFAMSDGEQRSMAELLELPEEEAATVAQPMAFTFAEAGQRNGLLLDLEPGRYGVVCFVPVGGAEDGAPHFVHGMVDDFVVT